MLVSVIIAARNAAETLGDALDSLRAQTYPSWEAIVVDDSSTDETIDLARRLAKGDSRINAIEAKTPQAGAGTTRNRGIAEAQGECFLFLDADDRLEPQQLELLTASLRAKPSAGAPTVPGCG